MIKIKSLNDINQGKKEGKLLMAALAKLTTELYTNQTPYEVLDEISDLANAMYFMDEHDLRIKIREDMLNGIEKIYYKNNSIKANIKTTRRKKLNKVLGNVQEEENNIPKTVIDKVNEKVDELFESLKEFGLFDYNNI